MNNDSLILFIQRILESGSRDKACVALGQLRDILIAQGANPSMVELVRDTISGIDEAQMAVKSRSLTAEELRIAIRRAGEMRRRQTLMNSMGRC